MFDSIVEGRQRAERRLGAGALLSIALHAAAVALALWLPTRVNAPAGPAGVEVAFLAAPTLEPAGGSGSAGEPVAPPAAEPEPAREIKESKTEPVAAPRKTRAPKPERSEPVPEADPEPAATTQTASVTPSTAASGNAATQSARGQAGGSTTVSATVGGQNHGSGRGAQPGTGVGSVSAHRYEILPFGPGMTRPQLLGGRDPVYTRAARMARVEGTVIARCVITVQGRLEKCRIVKGQPHMDEAVLQALATRRYTPVTFQGHVQAVLYNVTISLRMRE